MIGDVEVPPKFDDVSYRKRLIGRLLKGSEFRLKKSKRKKYYDRYFVWLSRDLSKLFYTSGTKKGNEKKCKYTTMDDVHIVYAGPPVSAYDSDRERWKDGDACLTIRTSTGHRCLDLEARDAVLYLGQRNRDMWVEGLKMALFLRHYRHNYKDVIEDLETSSETFTTTTNKHPKPLSISVKFSNSSSNGRKNDGATSPMSPSLTSRADSEISTGHLQRRRRSRRMSKTVQNAISNSRRGRKNSKDEVRTSREDANVNSSGSTKHHIKAQHSMSSVATDDVIKSLLAKTKYRDARTSSVVERRIRRRLKGGADLSFPALSTADIVFYVGTLPEAPQKCLTAKRGLFSVSKDYDGVEQLQQLQHCIRQFNTVIRSPSVALSGKVTFLTTITGLRQVLQPMIPLLEKLVHRHSARQHSSKTQNILSEYLANLYGKIIPTRDFLKMLAYVSKYRSLTIANDNSNKRTRSLQKILELYPNISRHLDGELRRHLVSRDFAFSPPVIGGGEEGGDAVGKDNQNNTDQHTIQRKTSVSQRRLPTPTRSSGDVVAGSIGQKRKPNRRHSHDASKRDLTKPMMELQRVNKARRLLEDVKRIAENWIYMLKQVEEQEKIFTTELMERLEEEDSDDNNNMLESDVSSKSVDTVRPKSGTLVLSKDYNLERYALPGIHLPKSMVRLFYEYWKKNIQNKDKMSFSRFMLYFPYKTQQDIASLVVKDKGKFEELCNARISQGFGVKAVAYYETAKQRAPYRVRCGNDGVLRDAKARFLDTKHLSTTMSGRGVGMIVFRRPSNEQSEEMNEAGIFVHIHRIDKVHHSSIFAGGAVDFAGEIKAENGSILWISNKSGHYKPGPEACLEFLHFLTEKRIDLEKFAFDIVKKSIDVEILRRVCPEVSSLDRGRGSYWRIPSARVMYEGLLKPSLWNESYASYLRGRFSPVIIQKLWRDGDSERRWKWCARDAYNVLKLVQRGMIAVDSYEAMVIDKVKLEQTLSSIPIRYLRLVSGGTRSLLANCDDTEQELKWYYRSESGSVRGPHKSEVVYIWIRRGKLKSHVELSCNQNGPYRKIEHLSESFVKLLAMRDVIIKRRRVVVN